MMAVTDHLPLSASPSRPRFIAVTASFARFLRNRESGILIFYFQLLRYVLHRKLEHFSTNACTEVNVTVLIIRHGCDGVPSLSAYMMDTLLI